MAGFSFRKMTLKTPKSIYSPLFNKLHQWIVYRLQDGRSRAAMIRTQEDLKYFRARKDIIASILISALNRSEAWREGKDLIEG